MDAVLTEKSAAWEEFESTFAAVVNVPQDWGRRNKLVMLCETMTADSPEKLKEAQNNVVVDEIPAPGRLKKFLSRIGLESQKNYEKENFLSGSECIVVKGGTFDESNAFKSSKKVVVLNGRFLKEGAFAGCSEAIVFGGTFMGEHAFKNAEKIIVLGGTFYGAFSFSRSVKAKVLAGLFLGARAFSGSIAPEIIDGTFKGEYAFEKSVGCNVKAGKFFGKQAFLQAKNTTVTNGEFHGENLFEKSEYAKVWGGKWYFDDGQPKNAFQHALNVLLCIKTPFESIDSPVNGIFVAQYFNEITNKKGSVLPGGSSFYVTDCRGKHYTAFHRYISRIDEKHLAAVSDPALFDKEYLRKHGQQCYKKGI